MWEQSVSFAGSPFPAHILNELFLAGVPVLPGGMPRNFTHTDYLFSKVIF